MINETGFAPKAAIGLPISVDTRVNKLPYGVKVHAYLITKIVVNIIIVTNVGAND